MPVAPPCVPAVGPRSAATTHHGTVTLYALRAAARGTGRLASIAAPRFYRRANDGRSASVTVRYRPAGGGPALQASASADLDACYGPGRAWQASWRTALATCAEAAALRAALPELADLRVEEEPEGVPVLGGG